MNALVLLPSNPGLRFACVSSQCPPGLGAQGTAPTLSRIGAAIATDPAGAGVDLLVIRSLFGGEEFPVSTLVDPGTLDRLARLTPAAPLQVEATRALIAEAAAVFPKVPVALAFETSFFARLPARETAYALPGMIAPGTRRWGYHGLFHEAAADYALSSCALNPATARILSLCLEPNIELAAIRGRTPRMVTGGSTPLEGLPGERSCGDIDPSIPLALAADPAVGPEQVNLWLTRESGFTGMLGKPTTLGQVLRGKGARITRARELLLYRILLAAGSAVAALEGVDLVVFSGRYAGDAEVIADFLLPKLERAMDRPLLSLPSRVYEAPIHRIVAEAGFSAWLARRG